MEIQLNNQSKEIASCTSIQQLLDEVVGQKQKGIAVAVNNTVVPKAVWVNHMLQANDNIFIIKAAQGG